MAHKKLNLFGSFIGFFNHQYLKFAVFSEATQAGLTQKGASSASMTL